MLRFTRCRKRYLTTPHAASVTSYSGVMYGERRRACTFSALSLGSTPSHSSWTPCCRPREPHHHPRCCYPLSSQWFRPRGRRPPSRGQGRRQGGDRCPIPACGGNAQRRGGAGQYAHPEGGGVVFVMLAASRQRHHDNVIVALPNA